MRRSTACHRPSTPHGATAGATGGRSSGGCSAISACPRTSSITVSNGRSSSHRWQVTRANFSGESRSDLSPAELPRRSYSSISGRDGCFPALSAQGAVVTTRSPTFRPRWSRTCCARPRPWPTPCSAISRRCSRTVPGCAGTSRPPACSCESRSCPFPSFPPPAGWTARMLSNGCSQRISRPPRRSRRGTHAPVRAAPLAPAAARLVHRARTASRRDGDRAARGHARLRAVARSASPARPGLTGRDPHAADHLFQPGDLEGQRPHRPGMRGPLPRGRARLPLELP